MTVWSTAERDELRKTVRGFTEREILPHVDDYSSAQRCLDLTVQWCEAGEWVAGQTVQLFGAMGYIAETEVERQYRDMRILGIGGGTTETLTGLAAKTLGYR